MIYCSMGNCDGQGERMRELPILCRRDPAVLHILYKPAEAAVSARAKDFSFVRNFAIINQIDPQEGF